VLWGAMFLGGANREAPVRTEPYPTGASPLLAPAKRQTPNAKCLSLPGGAGGVLGVSPGRFCLGPGLNVFVRFLRFSDLIPSIVVTGSIVATIQSEGGKAKSGNR
jgi:hypothetical protein